jgi:site-specific DNA-methyltransferase (adenine-specific)
MDARATVMGSYPYPINGIIKLDYEFILIFKKHASLQPSVKKSRSYLISSKTLKSLIRKLTTGN